MPYRYAVEIAERLKAGEYGEAALMMQQAKRRRMGVYLLDRGVGSMHLMAVRVWIEGDSASAAVSIGEYEAYRAGVMAGVVLTAGGGVEREWGQEKIAYVDGKVETAGIVRTRA